MNKKRIIRLLFLIIFSIIACYVIVFGIFGLGIPETNDEQIDKIIDCAYKFCNERDLESRWEKKPDGNWYLTIFWDTSPIICYDKDGKREEFYPKAGLYSLCKIELKSNVFSYLNLFYKKEDVMKR